MLFRPFFMGLQIVCFLMTDKEPAKISEPRYKRENPFRALGRLIKASAGKIPAHLVIIFVVALVVATIFGFVLRFSDAPQPGDYLVKRVKAEASQPALTEAVLRGIWAYQLGDEIFTLKMGSGAFEIVMRYPGAPSIRYFIRGGYRIEGNVLILQQRKDLGSPLDMENLQVKYYPMEFAALNLYASVNGRILSWRVPQSENGRLSRSDLDAQSLLRASPQWLKIANHPQ